MIKEFCGGKAGWNDRAIFIKTDLKPCVLIRSGRFLIFSNLWKKQGQNASPPALAELLYPSIFGILQVSTTPLSSCEGLFRVPSLVHPLLLIGHFAKLSSRLKEELTCLPHNSSNLAAVNFMSCPQNDPNGFPVLLWEHKHSSISHHLACGPTSGLVLYDGLLPANLWHWHTWQSTLGPLELRASLCLRSLTHMRRNN